MKITKYDPPWLDAEGHCEFCNAWLQLEMDDIPLREVGGTPVYKCWEVECPNCSHETEVQKSI